MHTLEIITCILLYPFFGYMASKFFIGDQTFYVYHYDSDFGPFNVFKGKTIDYYSEELEKKNVKRIIYFTLGGIFSWIFLIMYEIYSNLEKFVKTLKWAFSKK